MTFLLGFALLSTISRETQTDFNAFATGFATQAGTVNAGGALPGPVMAFGENAKVLAVAKDGKSLRPIIAAATYGKGRVLVIGHGGLLAQAGNDQLSLTILKWLHQSSKPIGLFADMIVNPAFGTPKRYRGTSEIQSAIDQCGTLLVGQSFGDNNPESIAMLDKFVQNGGGLILTGPAWGWMQLNPGKQLTDQSGQKLMAKMGLGFTDGTIDPIKGKFELLTPEPAHHVLAALAQTKNKMVKTPAQSKLIGDTLESAMSGLTNDHPVSIQLSQMLSSDQNLIRPTKTKPLTTDDFQLRSSAQYYDKTWRALSPEQVKAHPASQDFPGPVTGKDREDMTVRVGGKKRSWWSTGAYAAPGEVITVRLPENLKDLGLRLRIGGHNDTLWHLDKWERFPSIALEIPIKDGVAKAANPFGGLVYLVSNKQLPASTIDLENVVAAPTYFLGRTSDASWQKLKNSPAPWGEIVSNNCVVCVPSEVLRNLNNPKEVAEYWEEVVLQCELLYSVPAGSREERYQVDRQISAGYMHSGYPIMTWEDVAAKFVDIKILRGKDGNANWGFYHEIGHNFQRPSWTWNGWGETTNNLYSLFGGEHFNHDMGGAHGAMNQTKRAERVKEVIANPGKEEYYHKDPWYGLTFLRAIREEFGWLPFQTLFAEFRDLPRDQQPKSEQEKQDQFLIRMSKILKRDLSQYFVIWGVKNSDDAKKQSSAFPTWMPKGI